MDPTWISVIINAFYSPVKINVVKMYSKPAVIYLAFIGLLVTLVVFVMREGSNLPIALPDVGTDKITTKPGAHADNGNQVAVFILQLITIIGAAKIVGWLFSKLRQPVVMGEIVAGIILGPSLLGWTLPDVSDYLFPAQSMPGILLLSQIGLIFFMFCVGLELDLSMVRKKAFSAIAISQASMIIPFSLGITCSYFLYESLAPPNVPFHAFALFTGISMSVTAFPVLARIIKEFNLSGTRTGNVAIAAAAVDDVTAWMVLALIISVLKGESAAGFFYIFGTSMIYVIIMLTLVKPFLQNKLSGWLKNNSSKLSTWGLIFIFVLFNAFFTEKIGLHVSFGAVMAGLVFPHSNGLRTMITDKIESFVLVLLLPLFFVYTGLHTKLPLLSDTSLWLPCIAIILIAVAGKFGGGAVTARITGESVKDSLTIGFLLNTRGLMELIVLNIGFELGIISQELFTIMVIMALFTTMMAGPGLRLLSRMKG
jgi:Kef-type K+ transport system membrane component KefB